MKPIYTILLAIATAIVGGGIGFFAGVTGGAAAGGSWGMIYAACQTLETAEKDGFLKPEQSQKILNDATNKVVTDFNLHDTEEFKEFRQKMDCPKLMADVRKQREKANKQ
jgi:hypothetical protein